MPFSPELTHFYPSSSYVLSVVAWLIVQQLPGPNGFGIWCPMFPKSHSLACAVPLSIAAQPREISSSTFAISLYPVCLLRYGMLSYELTLLLHGVVDHSFFTIRIQVSRQVSCLVALVGWYWFKLSFTTIYHNPVSKLSCQYTIQPSESYLTAPSHISFLFYLQSSLRRDTHIPWPSSRI